MRSDNTQSRQAAEYTSTDVWQNYRENLPRHLIGVSRQMQSQVMHELQQELGHGELKLSFEPYITLVGNRGLRLTELADWLGISKQACKQSADLIETAGYIQRSPDPEDGRAKILTLSKRGRQLVVDGGLTSRRVESEFQALIGEPQMQALKQLLAALYQGLELPLSDLLEDKNSSPLMLGALLPRISDYITHRLMKLTISKGHPELKISHGQVLSLIGPNGGRISQIVKLQEISKQAVGVIAKDLEALGYLQRAPTAEDPRQLVLTLTEQGLMLLADSVASVQTLEQEFIGILGINGLKRLKQLAAGLFEALRIEEEVFAPTTDLRVLATQLKQQLGESRARELAHLLNSPPVKLPTKE